MNAYVPGRCACRLPGESTGGGWVAWERGRPQEEVALASTLYVTIEVSGRGREKAVGAERAAWAGTSRRAQ